MAIFVLMTKLNPEITKNISIRGKIGKQWLEKVKKNCPEVKFIAHYALLGQYDFMDIYEAPDNDSAGKVSLITLAEGAVKAESWPAFEYQDFVNLAEQIE